MTWMWHGPLARLRFPARALAPVDGVLLAALAGPEGAHAATFATVATVSAVASAPTPAPVRFLPANVPWPLSLAGARRAARAEAIRAWGARKPKVVSVHRLSYSRVNCRVTWRPRMGRRLTRTVKVKRTSAYGVQASAE